MHRCVAAAARTRRHCILLVAPTCEQCLHVATANFVFWDNLFVGAHYNSICVDHFMVSILCLPLFSPFLAGCPPPTLTHKHTCFFLSSFLNEEVRPPSVVVLAGATGALTQRGEWGGDVGYRHSGKAWGLNSAELGACEKAIVCRKSGMGQLELQLRR
jgi:hypothetical protein